MIPEQDHLRLWRKRRSTAKFVARQIRGWCWRIASEDIEQEALLQLWRWVRVAPTERAYQIFAYKRVLTYTCYELSRFDTGRVTAWRTGRFGKMTPMSTVCPEDEDCWPRLGARTHEDDKAIASELLSRVDVPRYRQLLLGWYHGEPDSDVPGVSTLTRAGRWAATDQARRALRNLIDPLHDVKRVRKHQRKTRRSV